MANIIIAHPPTMNQNGGSGVLIHFFSLQIYFKKSKNIKKILIYNFYGWYWRPEKHCTLTANLVEYASVAL